MLIFLVHMKVLPQILICINDYINLEFVTIIESCMIMIQMVFYKFIINAYVAGYNFIIDDKIKQVQDYYPSVFILIHNQYYLSIIINLTSIQSTVIMGTNIKTALKTYPIILEEIALEIAKNSIKSVGVRVALTLSKSSPSTQRYQKSNIFIYNKKYGSEV